METSPTGTGPAREGGKAGRLILAGSPLREGLCFPSRGVLLLYFPPPPPAGELSTSSPSCSSPSMSWWGSWRGSGGCSSPRSTTPCTSASWTSACSTAAWRPSTQVRHHGDPSPTPRERSGGSPITRSHGDPGWLRVLVPRDVLGTCCRAVLAPDPSFLRAVSPRLPRVLPLPENGGEPVTPADASLLPAAPPAAPATGHPAAPSGGHGGRWVPRCPRHSPIPAWGPPPQPAVSFQASS